MSEIVVASLGAQLKPIAVKIETARVLLAGKARSQIYELIARGELEALRDGTRTLITTSSIDRYMAALPPARFGRALTDRRLAGNAEAPARRGKRRKSRTGGPAG